MKIRYLNNVCLFVFSVESTQFHGGIQKADEISLSDLITMETVHLQLYFMISLIIVLKN